MRLMSRKKSDQSGYFLRWIGNKSRNTCTHIIRIYIHNIQYNNIRVCTSETSTTKCNPFHRIRFIYFYFFVEILCFFFHLLQITAHRRRSRRQKIIYRLRCGVARNSIRSTMATPPHHFHLYIAADVVS